MKNLMQIDHIGYAARDIMTTGSITSIVII